MSTFSTLEIGKRALIAQRVGIDVTSNNISNADTVGYSKRDAVLTETDSQYTRAGYVGTGTMVSTIKNYREEFFDKEIRKSVSLQAGYDEDSKIYTQVEAVLSEPSDSGLTEVTADFLNSFEDLASDPQNVSLRETTLEKGKTLVDTFHSIADKLDTIRTTVANDARTNITTINADLQKVADLNGKIASSNLGTSSEAQSMVDERETTLEELSKLAGITATQNTNGSMNVYVNGINLVTDSTASKVDLQETANSATGERTLNLVKLGSDNNSQTVLNPTSSEIASQLKNYNVTLDGKESGAGFSIYKKVNEFANSVVSKVNSLTVSGYGLDDKGTTSPGRAFFTPITGNADAANIEINQEIKDDVRKMPLSDSVNESGNNKVAMKLSKLSSDSDFIQGSTPSEFVSAFLSKFGSIEQEASNGSSTTSLVTQQLTNQRESVIGVDTNEEAVNLIKYQKSFEAASRIVNTTNELLSTIINLGT